MKTDTPERVQTIAEFLEKNRSEFQVDPKDDSFFVHRLILAAMKKVTNSTTKAFRAFTEPFGTSVMMLQPGGMLEFFPSNLPGIDRIVFTKGDGVCILHLREIVPFLEEDGAEGGGK